MKSEIEKLNDLLTHLEQSGNNKQGFLEEIKKLSAKLSIEILSDHSIRSICAQHTTITDFTINAATWNLLKRCHKDILINNKKIKSNNLFKVTENEHSYVIRKIKQMIFILEYIGDIYKARTGQNLQVFLLQEVDWDKNENMPKMYEAKNIFYSALENAGWGRINSGILTTLYNKKFLTPQTCDSSYMIDSPPKS